MKSAFETPEQSPGFTLWQISIKWRRALETVLKPLGLTHPQFVILATTGWLTRKGERVTQAAVGKLAELDPNTTSQILHTLEKKGWVKRIRTLDERSKSPMLTPSGKALLKRALPLVEKTDALFFKREHESLQRLILLADYSTSL